MIVHWEQLPLAYGSAVDLHRAHFETAGQTTHALLCCRLTLGNDRVAASGGQHAERKLLRSALWAEEIPAALERASPLDRSPLVVTMAVNRTPCPACTTALEEALHALQWRYPLRFQQARFILACRGAYQGRVGAAGWYEEATTVGHLQRLRHVGWEPCVLQTGPDLPPSGAELLQALQRLTGERARPTRLQH